VRWDLRWCGVAAASSIFNVAGGYSLQVAVEVAVAGSQLGGGRD